MQGNGDAMVAVLSALFVGAIAPKRVRKKLAITSGGLVVASVGLVVAGILFGEPEQSGPGWAGG